MSALGHKRTFAVQYVMSVLPPKSGHVQCSGPCLLWAKSGHVQRKSSFRDGPVRHVHHHTANTFDIGYPDTGNLAAERLSST
jgi:hypothetical protein